MKFYVVTAKKESWDPTEKAVICEQRAVQWVEDELEGQGYNWINAVPAECHWTAQVLPTREGGDLSTGWEG